MLTDNDVDFMRSSQESIRSKREKLVKVYSEVESGEHPISGELIIDKRTDEMPAVVTEVSVRTSLDRRLDDGIEIRTGDILVDILLKDVPEGVSNNDMLSLKYDGEDYTVLAADKLGLAGFNRIEIIGRLSK